MGIEDGIWRFQREVGSGIRGAGQWWPPFRCASHFARKRGLSLFHGFTTADLERPGGSFREAARQTTMKQKEVAMKRALPLAVLAAAALCAAFTGGDPEGGSDLKPGMSEAPFGIGQKVAGAWLIVTDFGNGPFEGEVQLFADGNAVMNNTVLNGGNNHLTTGLGAWKQTGPQTIALTVLIRIVDPNGALLSYEKIVSEATIEGDAISGVVAGLIYLSNQNPLDPEATPVKVYGPSELIGQRIGVAVLPE